MQIYHESETWWGGVCVCVTSFLNVPSRFSGVALAKAQQYGRSEYSITGQTPCFQSPTFECLHLVLGDMDRTGYSTLGCEAQTIPKVSRRH